MAANAVNIEVKADGSQASGQFQKVSKAVAGVSLAVAGVGLALVKIGDEFQTATRNNAIDQGHAAGSSSIKRILVVGL